MALRGRVFGSVLVYGLRLEENNMRPLGCKINWIGFNFDTGYFDFFMEIL